MLVAGLTNTIICAVSSESRKFRELDLQSSDLIYDLSDYDKMSCPTLKVDHRLALMLMIIDFQWRQTEQISFDSLQCYKKRVLLKVGMNIRSALGDWIVFLKFRVSIAWR